MMLGDNEPAAYGSRATLDGLFRRAGVRDPDRLALADPPDRERFTDGAPRRLSFAQADRAISAVAARLRKLGLPTDAVIAIQLPNTVESVIAFMGVLRAGMIASPLPPLWRRQDMVAALARVGAKAIITCARMGAAAPAENARSTAAALFSIRHVCGFGRDLPDGVVPLDDCLEPDARDLVQLPSRPGPASAHVAAVTFDVAVDGFVPMARDHRALIAGGLAPFLEAGMREDEAILSAVPPASFGGLALTIMPWLFSGGSLHLHQPFDPDAFAAQCEAIEGGTAIVPGPVLAPLTESGRLGASQKRIVALWRAPERLVTALPWRHAASLVDVVCFGEVGLIASRRGNNGTPVPIPDGSVSAPRGAAEAFPLIETACKGAGMLGLRGPMVPRAFPPGTMHGCEPLVAPDPMGFIDTGYACRRDADVLIVTGPPAGVICVGGERLRTREIDALVANIDANATIAALPDATLGERLAAVARNRAAMLDELNTRGAHALIATAFRRRRGARAA